MAKGKRKNNKFLEKSVAEKPKELKYLSEKDADLLGFSGEGQNQNAYVYLKYFQDSYECFSEWDKKELKSFSEFCNKLKSITWNDIYKSGGKLGKKKGVGYTKHDKREKLPNNGLTDIISPDITFFELRVTQKARVHGFRIKSVFCLVWLDRNHRVYKM